MLEITCGEFAYDILIKSNKEFNSFPNSEYVNIELFLSFGDISDLSTVNNRVVIGQTVNANSQIKNLLNIIDKHNKIRIWISTQKTEDYLNMMLMLYLLKSDNKQREISIVDSVNVPVDARYPNTPAWELACLEPNRIKELLTYEENLSNKKVIELLLEWDEIIKINSSLRIYQNGVIKSVDEDYFDHIMLDIIKKQVNATMSELVGYTMAECNQSGGNLCDQFFAYRLDKLIEAGMIMISEKDAIPYHSIITVA